MPSESDIERHSIHTLLQHLESLCVNRYFEHFLKPRRLHIQFRGCQLIASNSTHTGITCQFTPWCFLLLLYLATVRSASWLDCLPRGSCRNLWIEEPLGKLTPNSFEPPMLISWLVGSVLELTFNLQLMPCLFSVAPLAGQLLALKQCFAIPAVCLHI